MKSSIKKTVSVAVASAMIISMAGCSLFDKSKDEVLEAADPIAKALASCNVSKIGKGSTDDFEDIQEDWEELLDFSVGDEYDSDEATALSAIADSISYEIDEESVDASKKSGEGSVSVTFTIADYESVLDEDYTDVDDFVDGIEDAETTEIEVTLEFEKDDDEWLFSNYEEVFDELYAFVDEEYSFIPPFADCVRGVTWYGGNYDGTYNNATYIDMDLDLDWSDNCDYSSIYYEISYNGQVIKTETGTYMAYLYSYDPGVPLDDSGYYIAAGSYEITFYEADGTVILTETATVTTEVVPLEVESELYWWFKDNYDNSNPEYVNTDTIDGQLEYTSGTPDYNTLTFTLSYNGEVIYEGSGTTDAWIHTYDIDNCPLDPSGEYFAAGEYTITFYQSGELLVADSCTVIVE